MVIITGNRRSGTSITAKILHKYGLDFGKGRYHVKEFKGGFENVKMMKFNRRLAMGAVDIGLPREEGLRIMVKKHKDNMIDLSKKLPFVKNPHFAKVIEAWIFAGVKIEFVIVVLRDYKEVAESLKMNLPTFFNMDIHDSVFQQAAEIGNLINILEKYQISYVNIFYPRDFKGNKALYKLADKLDLNHEKLSKISNELFIEKPNYKTKIGKLRR